jgi:hypothetical protein
MKKKSDVPRESLQKQIDHVWDNIDLMSDTSATIARELTKFNATRERWYENYVRRQKKAAAKTKKASK